MVQPAPETKAEEAFDPEWTAPDSALGDGLFSSLEDGLFSHLENEPLWLAHELTALDPAAIAALNAGETVDTLEKVARLERWLSALKARIVHRVGTSMTERARSGVEHSLASMNAVSETACVLNIPEGTAGCLLNESTALVNDFPQSLEALNSGTINYQHAQVIIRESTGVQADERAGYEESLLKVAPDLTRPQLAVRARRLREKMCPGAAAERRTKAEADRAVWLEPAPDGMAYLGAFLGAENAVAMFDRLTRAARAAQGPNEARTLAQLRADALAGLVIQDNPSLQEDGILSGIRPQVLVTVPVLSLLGESGTPGDLEGYGPIPASIARKLAANAPSLLRLLTDPVDSAVLDVGRRRYRVPKDLKTYLRVRDKTCRYPGCNRSAATADLDHTIPWEHGGSTRHGNLACLCPKHHRMKHEAGWSVRQHPGGVLAWTSPTGRNYSTRPEDPPAAVPSNAAQARVSAWASGRTPGPAWRPPPSADDPPPF